ncbi:MAG: hypothetical protein NEA02_17235 [Thermoanaerobaculia bacterium]|nr:hypothetical protein [Thermoanaerobaculia bacterium]
MSESGGAGAAPRPADAGLDEAGYATRIEDAFIGERGTPFLVSSKDWGLIRGWREAGIPADTVVRAIREAFERRRARGQAGKISSLAYCASAVEERWEMERRGLVGMETGAPAAGADAPAIREILASLSDRLRAGEEGKKDLLRKDKDPGAAGDGEATGELAEDFLRRGREKAAAKIDAIPREGPFEEIEKQLSAIEASLVRAGLKAMNPAFQSLVETRVSDALGDVAGVSPHVAERMRAALTRREVRALLGLPALTLLHG